MKLKRIVLGCENCDSVTIEGKYVKGICLGDIRESYVGFNDQIKKWKVIKNFALYVDKGANVQGKSKSCAEFSVFMNAFERIALGKDITGITLMFENRDDYDTITTEQNFGVEWAEHEDEQIWNPAQDAYICKDGNLCLVISKKKKIKDFFDILEVEGQEDVEFHL